MAQLRKEEQHRIDDAISSGRWCAGRARFARYRYREDLYPSVTFWSRNAA